MFQDDIKKTARDYGIELNMEIFYLKQLKLFSYFVKEYVKLQGKIDFKVVNVYHMPQTYKHYFQLPFDI